MSKTQFEQFYKAYGFSPGGINLRNTAFICEDVFLNRQVDWERVTKDLNQQELIACEKVRVVSREEFDFYNDRLPVAIMDKHGRLSLVPRDDGKEYYANT